MIRPDIGKVAPAFTTLDENDNKVALKDFRGKNVVLYFYPKAMTPGCTVQAQALRDHKEELAKLVYLDTPVKHYLHLEVAGGLLFLVYIY